MTLAKGDHIHKQTRGWLLIYLLELDDLPGIGTGRWTFWTKFCTMAEMGVLIPDPIPQIEFTMWERDTRFESEHLPETPFKHIQRVLKPAVQRYGRWYDDWWLDFQKWLLHGFGKPGLEADVGRIEADLRNYWYEEFNLAYLLQLPIDWPAQILQGRPRFCDLRGRTKWAGSTGFYSTPMNLCDMMAKMLFAGEERDTRLLTVCDPCCGTGSMLLPASNYSLRLAGVDIVPDLVLSTALNGYLWMPWIVVTPPATRNLFAAFDEGRLHDGYVLPAPEQEQAAIPAPAPPTGIGLETDPKRVEATKAYREGEISQADFFSILSEK